MKATNEPIDPRELLVKYITGEVGATEKLQIEQWIDADAENRQYYAHFKQLWDESLELANNNEVDEDKAWGRFRERVQKEYTVATKPAFNFKWLKVAAVVLVVSAAVLFGTRFFTHKKIIRYASATTKSPPISILRLIATDHIKIDTLPDGSTITQNRNSTINYLSDTTRKVELTGEAFFNVKHDPNKPFIIKVNDVLITVLGTSFNVKSNNKTTEVIVETGTVSVTRQQRTVALHPGEKLTTTDTTANFKKEPVTDKSYRNYLDKKVKKPVKDPAKTFKRDGVVKLDSVKRDAIK